MSTTVPSHGHLRRAAVLVSAAALCGLLSAGAANLPVVGENEEPGFDSGVRSIAERAPRFIDALPLDESIIEHHALAEPPESMVKEATVWVRKIVSAAWLPDGWKTSLIALKDWRTWEKRDDKGVVFSEVVGDYLCWRFEHDGCNLVIKENGLALSLRVDQPQAKDIAEDPEAFIRECIVRFLNVPEDYPKQVTFKLKEAGGIYYGDAVVEDESASNMWWQWMCILTDGKVFFVYAGERDGTELSPRAKPGLPDRF